MTAVSGAVVGTRFVGDELCQRSFPAVSQPVYLPHALVRNLHHRSTHSANLILPERAGSFPGTTNLNREMTVHVLPRQRRVLPAQLIERRLSKDQRR